MQEVVWLGDRALDVVRPRDSEALLDERAFAHEEYLPYWADVWPSGLALARAISVRALRGARTLELGCGLGLPAIAAALAGGRVLATDWAPDAIAFTQENARRNGAVLETAVRAWRDLEAPPAGRAWQLVLAADVLYEQRNVDELLEVLPRLAGARTEVLLADPDRPPAARFLAQITAAGWSVASPPPAAPARVRLHRLRRTPAVRP